MKLCELLKQVQFRLAAPKDTIVGGLHGNGQEAVLLTMGGEFFVAKLGMGEARVTGGQFVGHGFCSVLTIIAS